MYNVSGPRLCKTIKSPERQDFLESSTSFRPSLEFEILSTGATYNAKPRPIFCLIVRHRSFIDGFKSSSAVTFEDV
uniref:Uncharacterized protein n=1 Tax=Romanomermis culicivorax TaxID=13658 RepID=A0A915JQU4_ROMCU